MEEMNGSTRQNDEIIEEIDAVKWLDDEAKTLKVCSGDFEKLPSPVFAENKITTLRIDAGHPFKKWEDKENNKTKAIIPCITEVDGKMQKANWWLNVSNPTYKEVIHICREAENKNAVDLEILQIGTKQNTKYQIVKR